MAFKITEDNYLKYKTVFRIIWRHQLISISPTLANVTSPIMPTEVIDQWEGKSKKLAMKGLQHGLLDVLTNITHHQKSVLEAMDRELQENDLPSINKLIAMARGYVQRALKRGMIKTKREYYIIKELLDDTESDITEVERSSLNVIMAEFERISKK